MRKLILIAAMVGGLAAAVLGPLLGVLLGLLMALQRGSGVNAAAAFTLGLTLAVVGLGLGLPLAWVAWRALQGYPAETWLMPAWWLLLVAFVAALVFGQAALSAGLTILAPIFHILAGALPALLFVSLTTHRGADLPGRQRIGALAWGALGGTGIAIVIELALAVAAMVAGLVWITATNPALLDALREMALEMQGGTLPESPGPLADLFRSPLIAAAALGSISVAVPLVEEAVKGLVVPLVLLAGIVPTRRQAFLLGVTAGAGFALVEGALNGVMALMNPATWGGLMLVRGGTAAVHCVATGFVALGWYAILVEKSWLRGIGLGLLGCAIHGAWNLAAGAQTLSTLLAQGGGASAPAQGLFTGGAVAVMGAVWVAAVTVLVMASRRGLSLEAAATLPEAALPPEV
jgi:hypothetical protein